MLFDNWLLVEDGRFREAETLRAAHRARRYPSRNPQTEPRRPARPDRRQREGRRGSRAGWSTHFGLDVVQAYMRHVQDNAEEAVRRVIDALKDGEFALRDRQRRASSGCASRVDRENRARDDRLHRHVAAAGQQLQRAVRGGQRGRAVRLPHAGRRRHPAQRRLPEAAATSSSRRARCSRPSHPAAVVAGNVETSQSHHRRALRRARRAGRGLRAR